MGLLTESAVLNQLKKAAGETNERLDRQNELLEKILEALRARPS